MKERVEILGLESSELGLIASRTLGSGSGLAGRIYARAFERGELATDGLGLSATSEASWREGFSVRRLELLRVVHEGEGDRATAKALLGLDDGRAIECVRIPMPGGDGSKSSLCISSQVGCRMGCAFCETGRAGFTRDLEAWEIVSQVLTLRVELGWNCGNIVFMGMGECMDNLDAVARSLRVLGDSRGFGYSQEKLTLCSSVPPGSVDSLRALGLKRLNLSISLNAANDEKRDCLMPVNRGYGLEALASDLAAYPLRRNFALGVNWCLMPGINDSPADAREAAAFCARVGRSIVNLIPYNPGRMPIARAPSADEVDRFAALLESEGCAVKRRALKGASIMAGCGQLGGLPE